MQNKQKTKKKEKKCYMQARGTNSYFRTHQIKHTDAETRGLLIIRIDIKSAQTKRANKKSP